MHQLYWHILIQSKSCNFLFRMHSIVRYWMSKHVFRMVKTLSGIRKHVKMEHIAFKYTELQQNISLQDILVLLLSKNSIVSVPIAEIFIIHFFYCRFSLSFWQLHFWNVSEWHFNANSYLCLCIVFYPI